MALVQIFYASTRIFKSEKSINRDFFHAFAIWVING